MLTHELWIQARILLEDAGTEATIPHSLTVYGGGGGLFQLVRQQTATICTM